MTSHIADAALRRATVGGRGPREPHLAAGSHIELTASPAPVAIRERHHAVRTVRTRSTWRHSR